MPRPRSPSRRFGGAPAPSWIRTLPISCSTRAEELLGELDEVDAYQAVLEAEPTPLRRVEDNEMAGVARTFGNLVDLKSPWFHGHSAAVGDLAAGAAGTLGLRDEMETLRDRGVFA